MITENQEKNLLASIPEDTEGEDRRAAYAVITGMKESKNKEQIAGYYSIEMSLVEKWINHFGLSSSAKEKTAGKRGRKGKDLASYVKSNSGRVVTPKLVAEEVGISLPTFYNFYNANRNLFKKVKRGEFEIVSGQKGSDSF